MWTLNAWWKWRWPAPMADLLPDWTPSSKAFFSSSTLSLPSTLIIVLPSQFLENPFLGYPPLPLLHALIFLLFSTITLLFWFYFVGWYRIMKKLSYYVKCSDLGSKALVMNLESWSKMKWFCFILVQWMCNMFVRYDFSMWHNVFLSKCRYIAVYSVIVILL